MFKSFDWQHAVLLGLTVVEALLGAYANQTGHPLVVHGVVVAGVVTAVFSLWKGSPAAAEQMVK